MGKKLYKTTESGTGFVYKKTGFTMVENHVIDLWQPLIGEAIRVYITYCRLARDHYVKAISQEKLAKGMRIGRKKLRDMNEILEECGFIKIRKPEGHEIRMGWSTTIEILDPPKTVPQELIEKYQHPSGYEIIAGWLMEDDDEQEKCDNITSRLSQVTQPMIEPSNATSEPGNANKNEDLNIEDSELEDLIKECADAREFFEQARNKASKDLTPEDIDERIDRAKRLRDKMNSNMPLDWVVAHAQILCADKEQVDKAKEKDSQKLAGQLDERERYIKNMRSWVYPPYTELGIAFFKATGIKAVGTGEKKAWIKSFDRLYKKGVRPIDIQQGVKRMQEQSMCIKSPFSVETYALRMKNIREQYDRETLST